MVCDVCSTDLPQGALFCGECGASVVPQAVVPQAVVPPAAGAVAAGEAVADFVTAPRTDNPDTEILPLFLSDGTGVVIPPIDLALEETPILAALLKTVSVPASELSKDLPSYTFTLSTGETLAVSANGLLGRMPQPLPGESFAHLIVVTDTTRSVSKTHLEFGFDGDQLWILDRNSGNGSIIRDVGKIARRAEPGRQYLVSRGTRIDMGEAQLLIS